MTTTAQTNANRANSQHSTGPTTESGKRTSSQNSLKHGLASSQLIIPGESEEEFNTFLAGLLTEHQPVTLTEMLLVQDMAKHHWLIDRSLRLQSEAIAQSFDSLDKLPALLAILIRYQTANERAFQRAFATLNAMRKAAKQDIGSASKSAAQAAKQAAATDAAEAKATYAEWHARFLRETAPPMKIEEMEAAGFVENPETGNWEKHIA